MTLIFLLMLTAIAEQAQSRKKAAAAAAQAGQALPEPRLVSARLTPTSAAEVLGALTQAWTEATGQSADPDGILILAAHAAMETGNFARLYDYNLGNLRFAPGGGGDLLRTASDGYDFAHFAHHPNVPQVSMMYRVYPDLASGAQALIDWAYHHGAAQAVASGDLPGFMNALRAGCYLGCVGSQIQGTRSLVSQSDYDTYERALSSYMARFSTIAPQAPEPSHASGAAARAHAGQAAAEPSFGGWAVAGAVLGALGAIGGLAYIASASASASRTKSKAPVPAPHPPLPPPAPPPAPAPAPVARAGTGSASVSTPNAFSALRKRWMSTGARGAAVFEPRLSTADATALARSAVMPMAQVTHARPSRQYQQAEPPEPEEVEEAEDEGDDDLGELSGSGTGPA
jgi:hypothetical protein